MNTQSQPIAETAPSLFKPAGRKPTGKIAQLPKAQRDIINQMLDDGATYEAIETEMAKHGVSLNGENISNWFQNGFQQYLQHQDHIAEMRLLRENASDLVQDYNVVQFHQAANQLAVGQIFKALTHQQLIDDPINYVRVLNALSRLSRAALILKQSQDEDAKAAAQTAKSQPVHDLETQRKLMLAAFEGATGVKAAPGPIGLDLNQYFSSQVPLTKENASDQHESLSTEHATRSIEPASSIKNRKSKIKNSSQEARPSCAPASTNPRIQQSHNPPCEPCPSCFAPLPPLLPSGERLYPHCQNCGTSLRPPGALIEYCPHCQYLLPELNSAGHRPTPDCPACLNPLPAPSGAPALNPPLPNAA
jgi:hypothetical protein